MEFCPLRFRSIKRTTHHIRPAEITPAYVSVRNFAADQFAVIQNSPALSDHAHPPATQLCEDAVVRDDLADQG
jgi:hypothetical protein